MKRTVWIIMAVCALSACRERSGYTINGEIAGANGMSLTLKAVNMDSMVDINSCTVKKGKFKMKGLLKYPEYCVLYAGNNGPLPLFVENKVINIVIDLANMQDSKVTGSPENDLLDEYNSKMMEFEESFSKVNNDYMSMVISDETDDEKVNGFIAQMDTLQQQRTDWLKQFASKNHNNMVTALIVYSNLSHYITPDELEIYADGFDAVNSESPWVQSIKEKAVVAKSIETGQPFVDIRMSAPDGKEIALSDYAGKGKYVLIDFWASWCSPCRIANPNVVKMYDKYKDRGFEIVGVSLDNDKSQWTRAIREDKLTWPQMSDLKYWQSEGAKLYMVSSIPNTVLLDRDGKIIAKGLNPDELETKLAELLE